MGGGGMIPFISIDAWARRRNVEGEDFDWLVGALHALMDLQLRHESEERAKASKK